ncbi:hypothetical protein [Burkholderia ubonensis]|uniref:hypothetical protein n=1 Tax=Burkholderia ubonensis TaxID=101571 RepID=UPI0009B312E0|nr:hypothetical protein [Burkholderia ubonensis]
MTSQADEQRTMVRSILRTAMAILRDDKPFNPTSIVFGRNFAAKPHPPADGRLYRYTNPVLPSATIEFSTGDDPEDYSIDRSQVKIVPAGVRILLDPMIADLPDAEIKHLLQLEDYWIDYQGEKNYGNEIMGRTPDAPNAQTFRYRAKNIPGSKFPVNVELFYANPLDGSFPQMLGEIRIKRDYKFLSPEERGQRRLEQQRAKRQKYGEMNLCTGMICPETGMWEGWSDTGPTDLLLVHAGRKFPEVRIVHFREQWYSPRAPGRWMWLKDDSERGQD